MKSEHGQAAIEYMRKQAKTAQVGGLIDMIFEGAKLAFRFFG
jgi:hypothetical protein